MHLQHKFRLKAVSDQAALNLVHGELDDIGRTALHGMVHRRALAEAALHFVARLQLGNMALAAEHRGREPTFLRLFNRLVEVGAHARIGLEITVNHILSLFETDSQALGQAERLLAIDDTEVHGLRATAQLRGDLFHGNAEHACGGVGMEVGARAERIYQVLVTRQMREQAKLDLRVVGRNEHIALAQRHEASTHTAAEIGAHGNVLQVRVARRQTARGSDRLVEARVHQAVDATHARQGVKVSGLHFRELAIAQHLGRDGMHVHELAERFRIGGIAARVLLARRQLEHFKQNMAELLGRIDVEFLTRKLMNLGAQPLELGRGFLRHTGELVDIDARAHAFHLRERRDERQIDALVHLERAVALERLAQRVGQTVRDEGMRRSLSSLVFALGQSRTQIRVAQRAVFVFRDIGIQQVCGQTNVEEARRMHLRCIDERRFRGIDWIDFLQRALAIECTEMARTHDFRKRLVGIFALKHEHRIGQADEQAVRLGKQAFLRLNEEFHAQAHVMLHGGFQRVVRVVAHDRRQAGQLERGGRGKRFVGAGKSKHLGQMSVEAHLAKSLGDLRAVEIGEFHALQIEVELHIAHDGRHAAARVRVFLMLGKVLQLLALELVEVVVDAVDAAVVLQKFRGGLVANAGHAGNVV